MVINGNLSNCWTQPRLWPSLLRHWCSETVLILSMFFKTVFNDPNTVSNGWRNNEGGGSRLNGGDRRPRNFDRNRFPPGKSTDSNSKKPGGSICTLKKLKERGKTPHIPMSS